MIKIITIFTKFIVVAIIAFAMHSCNFKLDIEPGEEGNGKTTVEVRKINEDFTGIKVNSGINVVVMQSDEKFLSVETDSNLQKLVDTKVVNGVLHIEPNQHYNTTSGVKVIIKMPIIENIDLSSGSSIKGLNVFKGDNISVETSSAATADLNLKYDIIDLDASSGSSIKCKGIGLILNTDASSGANIESYGLFVNDVITSVSSGAKTDIHPIVSLDADASSGARVSYDSNPKSIKVNESSGGNIGKD